MDEFRLEEYRQVKARMETHERMYFQMLVLCISGFGVVLGFSEKLPKEVIPYIMAPLLCITSIIAVNSRQHQYFATSFLIEAFERSIPSIKYEQTYITVFSYIRYRLLFPLRMLTCIVSQPFIILTMLSIIGSIYFGADFVIANLYDEAAFTALLYVVILVCIHVIVIFIIIWEGQHKQGFYKKRCQEFLRKNTYFESEKSGK